MENYIYQIGRLDPSMGIKEFSFNIKEKEKRIVNSYLSSFALKEYLEKENNINDVQVVLAYPVSSFFNSSLLESKDLDEDFKKIIKEVIEDSKKEEYLKNPYNFFCKHPHLKNKNEKKIDYFILHSIGSYNTKSSKFIHFESRFEDIVFEILIDMINRIVGFDFKNNKINSICEEINLYIDVSSGHNIYVSALLEATKIFQQFFYLLNIFQRKRLNVKLVICDPISSHDGPYNIHIDYELKNDNVLKSNLNTKEVKNNIIAKSVFYELENINCTEFRNKKNKLSKILTSYGYIFSSLKNGIPLTLYQIEFCNINEAIGGLKEIIDYFKQQLNKSWLMGSNLNYDAILKSLYSIAFTISYLKIADEKGIKYKGYAYLDEIKKNFFEDEDSLLNILKFSVAKQLVANELNGYELKNKNFDNKSVIDRISENWDTLATAMPYFKGDREEGINKRNFLAHAGFERNIVLVKKEEGDNVLFKYKKDFIKDIEEFLLENL